SPTARGKYRWMILTSLLAWNPLWYAVTNTTIPSSMKMFRRWLVSVLTCWMLKSSGARAGAPPVRCTASASFSLNRATCWKYFCSLFRLTAPWVMNARATAGSRAMRSTSQVPPATGHGVRRSCRKLQPGVPSAGLSNNRSRAAPTTPWTKPRNCPMVKSISLYSSCSCPIQVTCPGAVVL
ncbi:hypothetical protein BDW68DRAFT_171369, partial [Aspergillus falconensis]